MVVTFETTLEVGYRDTFLKVEADIMGRTVRLYRVEDEYGSDVRYQLTRDERECLAARAYEDHRFDRAAPWETDEDIEDEAVGATEGAVG